MTFSCEDKTEKLNGDPCLETVKIFKSLNSDVGTVGFDSINKLYLINFHKEGTIDEILTAYPCELQEGYKTIGLKVKVKGDLYENNNLPKPSMGGQSIFQLKIKEIDLIRN